MNDFWELYCDILFNSIPLNVYFILLIILVIGGVVLFSTFGLIRGFNYIILLIIIEYIFALYGSTVFFRPTITERICYFMPLWSYMTYYRGENSQLLPENIMNITVFMPIGFLLGYLFSYCWIIKSIVEKLKKIFFIGMVVSIGIEVLQFVLMKGCFETDDIINNTIGCIIGYGLFLLIITLLSWPRLSYNKINNFD